jgi:hypothetical protein
MADPVATIDSLREVSSAAAPAAGAIVLSIGQWMANDGGRQFNSAVSCAFLEDSPAVWGIRIETDPVFTSGHHECRPV